jgi:hypothetical protein
MPPPREVATPNMPFTAGNLLPGGKFFSPDDRNGNVNITQKRGNTRYTVVNQAFKP